MRTTDFDFILPDALIAQFPAKQRSASRLLRLDGGLDSAALTKQSQSKQSESEPSKPEPSKPKKGKLSDALFTQLPEFLSPGDLLVFNDTRVIKARLAGRKSSGGSVEVMVERIIDHNRAHALIRASRAPKSGSRILLAETIEVTVVSREDDLFLLEFNSDTPILDLLDKHGELPLPPYITHSADAEDDERFQTVYAKEPGAVAAPTAGLHFDEAMLQRLQQHGVNIAYVTLHVGAGTFQPVRVDNIAEHKMHSELYSVPQATVDMIRQTKQVGGKVTCVGTTSLRALESAARSGQLIAGSGETDIFISPGYQFKVAERLLTNFHLPKSTLLMLVSAFAGMDNIRMAYQHAIAQKYRFFSYGDAMLIERQ